MIILLTISVRKTAMGKHKQVTCRICNKTMRSDNFKRHNIQHEKKNDPNLLLVNKLEDHVLKDGVEKYLLEKEEEFQNLIEKGKEVYEILGKGKVSEASLPKNMKEALNMYVMQDETFDNKDAKLKPWQAELLEEINNPTDRKIIWVVGKSCGEGKT